MKINLKSEKSVVHVTPTEAEKSAARYNRLVELTLMILDLNTLPKDFLKDLTPWQALVCTWNRYRAKMQCEDVIFSVLHYMKWSVYPTFSSVPLGNAMLKGTTFEKDMNELLFLFEEELRSPGSGLAELIKLGYYLCAFNHVNHTPYSQTQPRLESKSFYHRDFIDARFSTIARPFDVCKQEDDSSFPSYEIIKEAVKAILPAASGWSDAQWCDELFILSQIDNTYRTHYTKTPSEFDTLVDLGMSSKRGETDPDILLVSSVDLPFSLFQQLWPTNTEVVIENLYRTAYREARYHEDLAKKRKDKTLRRYEFGFANLANTAIQRLAEDLVATGKISGKRAKKQIFNVVACH